MNNTAIKYYKINRENETYKKFQKINLKKYDIYVNENQIFFVEKNNFKYRIRKYRIFDSIKKCILKRKNEIKTWFEKQNEINLLVR